MRRYAKPLIFLILALMLAGCGENKTEPSDVEIGMASLQDEAYSEALASFERAIGAGDDLIRAYRGAGMAYMGLGEYAKAVASFDESLDETKTQMKETRKDILYYKASALYRQQDYDGTIGVSREILDIEKEGDAFYLTGACYLEKNDESAARINFDAAVQASPEDYDLYLNIYTCYKDKKLSATGDEYLQKALTIESSRKEDAYHKAKIYYYLENYEEAQTQLTELVGEKDGDALLLAGEIALALEDPVHAKGLYEQYLAAAEETPEAYNGIVMAQMAQQDYDGALETIAKGLALDMEHGKQQLYYNEIVAYEYKGDFGTAKEKASVYAAKYPTDEKGQKEYEFLKNR